MLKIKGESRTRQSHARDADINRMMSQITQTSERKYFFADLTQIPDTIQGVFDLVSQANERFSSLPAAVRFRFQNNPAEILSFVSDPKNRDSAIELGLIPEPEGWVSPSEREIIARHEARKADKKAEQAALDARIEDIKKGPKKAPSDSGAL